MLENKNLILAVVLSVMILFAFNFLTKILYPQPAPVPPAPETQKSSPVEPGRPPAAPLPGSSVAPQGAGTDLAAPSTSPMPATAGSVQGRSQILSQPPRIRIDTAGVHGSISLVGGRIDDVTLVRYRETLDPN